MSIYSALVLSEAGLVSYWRLGEPSGTSATDSKGANTGTYTGGFTLAQVGAPVEDPDTAVLFNGTTGYVTVADAASVDLADGPFSLEAWFKSSAAAVDRNIFSKGTNAYALELGDTEQIFFRMDDFGSAMARSARTLNDGAYHHVVATKNGNSVFVYIDGVDDTVFIANVTLSDNALALNLGRRTVAGTAFFNGTLDELAIYNVVLSAAQVKKHYDFGKVAGLLSGLWTPGDPTDLIAVA